MSCLASRCEAGMHFDLHAAEIGACGLQLANGLSRQRVMLVSADSLRMWPAWGTSRNVRIRLRTWPAWGTFGNVRTHVQPWPAEYSPGPRMTLCIMCEDKQQHVQAGRWRTSQDLGQDPTSKHTCTHGALRPRAHSQTKFYLQHSAHHSASALPDASNRNGSQHPQQLAS
jgi:hypothetical protein